MRGLLSHARCESAEIWLTKCATLQSRKSKRTPVRLRHKIEKASSAKQEKALASLGEMTCELESESDRIWDHEATECVWLEK